MKGSSFRVLTSCLAVLALILMAACGSSKAGSDGSGGDGLGKELNVFNWSEYLPESVLKKFEDKTGVKVNYSTFSSNEEMLAKLSAGQGLYDLTMASDYIVQPMIAQGMIQPIDLNNIPNFKYLLPEFIDKDYDKGNKYTVPYMGNTQPIGINPDIVKTEITSYADLWKPELKNQIVLLDDQRMVLGMVLKTLGYSANDTDPAHLEEAKKKMLALMPNVKAFDSDSPKTLMISGEVGVMLSWGPEIALAQKEKPQVKTVLPKEGLIITFDNFVIPKGAKNKKAAEAFINFVTDPDISAEISVSFPYINPNVEARKKIDKFFMDNIAIYPPTEELKRVESLQDLGDNVKLYDRVWSEVKSSQ
ncbi:spermidine/putrescine ABC transporter substrate-binding protein [Cohnella pontilimi]|uniref:Spermidine/putrescine ABC transporter substrate-binding protein n=1 Tax=Cohnella pontilimi TaxID=2564100 RepID=A0A4U0FBK7_9BACL|nr:spermidine/putrescine ABC transporter substrate-binding protein [Cohnella pontilimi]TJY41564.1 spermidine/putrescine ABC transporter substrate-binding protein [Cohnella pontilimi]